MDRRSWLWRRKATEKSPGETESTGSVSSQSERYSDEQAYAAQSSSHSQSLEVTSKAIVADEDVNGRVKTLSDKLSAALLNISAKEELVKQHAKVAEEAVSGWENAENEVSDLKKKLESEKERSSALENRVIHLDGALKECVRQLRQLREEQEQKLSEAITEKTHEWKAVVSDLCPKLDAAESENSTLKSALEIRTIELDLSTKAAEAASKLNLESLKKVAKLESEIRRLKAVARKAASVSSFCVESFTDSQSDAGERILVYENSDHIEFDSASVNAESRSSNLVTGPYYLRNDQTHGKNLIASSFQNDLMDDFLEMERLAGLPDAEARRSRAEQFTESRYKLELDAMINKTANLEQEIEKKEAERAELEVAMRRLLEQLHKSQVCLEEAEARMTELEVRLWEMEGLKGDAEKRLEANESKLRDTAMEIESLRVQVELLEGEVRSERAEKAQKDGRLGALEEDISRLKEEAQLQHTSQLQQAANSRDEVKLKQTQELAVAATKFAECQRTIASLGLKLKSLASLEDFLDDSDTIPGLTDEEDPQHPESGCGPYKSDPSYLISDIRQSEYIRDKLSTLSQKGRARGVAVANLSEKGGRGLSKLSRRGSKPGS
ncbi:hypothetical protein SAY87_028528 [Trapa incisa]|uniref:Filament-like plant protein n=1 Tax=Trapa incisa TaxID=236973 RepID=A0AAN7QNS1_9MYRT|nr:hypothetical protein SAY87_028528 [Trapa incisa]